MSKYGSYYTGSSMKPSQQYSTGSSRTPSQQYSTGSSRSPSQQYASGGSARVNAGVPSRPSAPVMQPAAPAVPRTMPIANPVARPGDTPNSRQIEMYRSRPPLGSAPGFAPISTPGSVPVSKPSSPSVSQPGYTNPNFGNQDIADQLSGGISGRGPGWGIDVGGDEIRDYLGPDSSDRRLIERARESNLAAWEDMNRDITRTRDEYGRQAQYEGNRAREESLRSLNLQEDSRYGDERNQNIYSSYRNGQAGGSAQGQRTSKIYESSLMRRMDNEAQARRNGQMQELQILQAGDSIEDMIARSYFDRANLDKSILDSYQGTRPDYESSLGMRIEDLLADLVFKSAIDSAGA